jgi:hypothetical protein
LGIKGVIIGLRGSLEDWNDNTGEWETELRKGGERH